jgi:hypothetical protein
MRGCIRVGNTCCTRYPQQIRTKIRLNIPLRLHVPFQWLPHWMSYNLVPLKLSTHWQKRCGAGQDWKEPLPITEPRIGMAWPVEEIVQSLQAKLKCNWSHSTIKKRKKEKKRICQSKDSSARWKCQSHIPIDYVWPEGQVRRRREWKVGHERLWVVYYLRIVHQEIVKLASSHSADQSMLHEEPTQISISPQLLDFQIDSHGIF